MAAGTFAAAIGAGEESRLAADGNASECSFGRIVGQADPAVIERHAYGTAELGMTFIQNDVVGRKEPAQTGGKR